MLLARQNLHRLDDLAAPRLDHRAKTVFLRRTLARAVTPRAARRAATLRRMEDMIAHQEAGGLLRMNGHLLGSMVRAYPVSHSAIRREIRFKTPQKLVEIAEQIELGLWVEPSRRLL
jgi:hypothetical protein